jgi:hypothetical protein
MKNADTFSKTTKRDLADRAGHHCSLCLALTTCSDEMGKPFPIGDAAHQAAASLAVHATIQSKRRENALLLPMGCGSAARAIAR